MAETTEPLTADAKLMPIAGNAANGYHAPVEDTANGHHAEALPKTPEPPRRPLQPGEQYPPPIGPPIPNHPLSPFIGSLKDMPLWDEWQEAVREVRRQMHEEEMAREEAERQAEEATV